MQLRKVVAKMAPFNEKKCKVLHLGKNYPNQEYLLNGEKYLGVHIDNQLKFHVHAAAATKKAS